MVSINVCSPQSQNKLGAREGAKLIGACLGGALGVLIFIFVIRCTCGMVKRKYQRQSNDKGGETAAAHDTVETTPSVD
jgi:hypothetical protein